MATQLATTDEQPQRALSDRREAYAIMKDKAKMFAMSPLIPESLRGNNYDTAVANCLIALELASLMGEAPLVVMQNIHIVKGKAGFAAQYMIARANASGVFKGRIGWRISGAPADLSVTAFGTLADTGEEVSFTADMAMAKAEGWTSNSKYKTMPEVMLRYRSATFLVRFYAPDVMLGYHTSEEVMDVSGVIAVAPAADYRPLSAAMIEHRGEDTATTEEPNAGEGRDDTQMGEGFTEVDPATGELFEDPAATRIAEIRTKIDTAKDIDILGAVMADNRSHMAAMSEDVTADLWNAHARRKASFTQGGGK